MQFFFLTPSGPSETGPNARVWARSGLQVATAGWSEFSQVRKQQAEGQKLPRGATHICAALLGADWHVVGSSVYGISCVCGHGPLYV